MDTNWFDELTEHPVAVPFVALYVIAPVPAAPDALKAIGVLKGPTLGAMVMLWLSGRKVNVVSVEVADS